MKTITTIGLDIAKSVFQVHGIDAAGKVVIRKQLKRARVLPFFMKLPSCLVGIEACASSHYWARELTALGHEVKLMPPTYVKPYVKRQKNDAADAEAICEAVQRPNMRFVPIKSPEQQAGLALHRTRHLLIRQLTAVTNSIRAHLAELGIVAPVGRRGVDALIAIVGTGEDERIPGLMRNCLMTLSVQLTFSGSKFAFSIGGLSNGIDQMSSASGSTRFLAWVRRLRPRLSPASPIRKLFGQGGISRPGLGSCPSRIQAAVGKGLAISPRPAITITLSLLRRRTGSREICEEARRQAPALADVADGAAANKGCGDCACQ